MCFNAIRENKILAKISEFTVLIWSIHLAEEERVGCIAYCFVECIIVVCGLESFPHGVSC